MPPSTADPPDDSTAPASRPAPPGPARTLGAAGGGLTGVAPGHRRPYLLGLSPPSNRRRVTARAVGRAAGPPAQVAELVAADQSVVCAGAVAAQWPTTAAQRLARRLRAALAAELEQLARAGAAVSDRATEHCRAGQTAALLGPRVSLYRSGQRPGRQSLSAVAALPTGAVCRGRDRATGVRSGLAALPVAAQLPDPLPQSVATAAGRLRRGLLLSVAGADGQTLAQGPRRDAAERLADQQQLRHPRRRAQRADRAT